MYTVGRLPFLLSVMLEGSSGAPMCMSSVAYYDRLAMHVVENDPELMDLLTRASVHAQKTYRNAIQHRHHVSMVPVQKLVDDRVHEFLDQNCPVCLQTLKDNPHGVVRLRANTNNPEVCGHFMHQHCFQQFEVKYLNVEKTCPVCREDLGYIVQLWDDHESAVPKF